MKNRFMCYLLINFVSNYYFFFQRINCLFLFYVTDQRYCEGRSKWEFWRARSRNDDVNIGCWYVSLLLKICFFFALTLLFIYIYKCKFSEIFLHLFFAAFVNLLIIIFNKSYWKGLFNIFIYITLIDHILQHVVICSWHLDL